MSQEPTSNSIKPIRRGAGSFFSGATYPFRAFWLFVTQPNYRGYILIPIAINILLGITLYTALLLLGFRAIDAIIADVPHWMANLPQWSIDLPAWQPSWHLPLPAWQIQLPHWLSNLSNWRPTLPDWFAVLPRWAAFLFIWLLRLVLTLLLLLVTGFILLQFGVLLGAPWYGKLSEELEKMRTGQLTLIEVGVTQEIWRTVAYELKKLVIGFGIGIPLLILGFFPGIGTLISSILGIAVAATLVCLDFIDSPLERRRLRFRQKLHVIWQSLPASATFGVVCLGLVSIPLINLLAIPLCVAAGTLFVCDCVLPWLSPPSRE